MPQARASILQAAVDSKCQHGVTLRELQRMFAYLLVGVTPRLALKRPQLKYVLLLQAAFYIRSGRLKLLKLECLLDILSTRLVPHSQTMYLLRLWFFIQFTNNTCEQTN